MQGTAIDESFRNAVSIHIIKDLNTSHTCSDQTYSSISILLSGTIEYWSRSHAISFKSVQGFGMFVVPEFKNYSNSNDLRGMRKSIFLIGRSCVYLK